MTNQPDRIERLEQSVVANTIDIQALANAAQTQLQGLQVLANTAQVQHESIVALSQHINILTEENRRIWEYLMDRRSGNGNQES